MMSSAIISHSECLTSILNNYVFVKEQTFSYRRFNYLEKIDEKDDEDYEDEKKPSSFNVLWV